MNIKLNAQVINGVGKAGERKTYGPGIADVPDGLAKQLLRDGTAVVVKVAAKAPEKQAEE